MDEKTRNELDDVEIAPLSDEDLDAVAGGSEGSSNDCCSCSGCSPAKEVDQVA